MTATPVNLTVALASFDKIHSPRVVARVNNYDVRVADVNASTCGTRIRTSTSSFLCSTAKVAQVADRRRAQVSPHPPFSQRGTDQPSHRPPSSAILGDLLDLNIDIAVQWSQHASRDWSHYLEARIGATPSSHRAPIGGDRGDVRE